MTAAHQNHDTATTDIVTAHRFDEGRLYAYLQGRIADLGSRLEVRQFQGGTSNPTFLLTTGGAEGPRRYVLRKKPPGALLASAHQVDREFRVMKALEGLVPVPHMHHLCEDADVIGAPFYVMDYLQGRIFRDARLPDLPPLERTAIYDQLNLTLTKLHRIDSHAVGLSDYGRPGNYFERQVKRWTKQYRDAETEPLPEMEALIETLPKLVPAGDSISISHGDYRLENTMFACDEPRLIAVLDWELSTIGHPLADIAYNCFLWHSKRPSWGHWTVSTSRPAAFRPKRPTSRLTAAGRDGRALRTGSSTWPSQSSVSPRSVRASTGACWRASPRAIAGPRILPRAFRARRWRFCSDDKLPEQLPRRVRLEPESE